MPELGLKEYLETATTASTRARAVTVVLVAASVLVFAGYLNSSDYGWMQLRLDKLKDPNSNYYKRYIPQGKQEQGKQEQDAAAALELEEFRALYTNLQRAYIDNAYVVKVPFFGVAFDVNDLGPLGGFSLVVILLILRLSLRTQIVSLRIAFKRALRTNEAETFYDLLAARQVFVFPTLKDEQQDTESAKGRTERTWEKIKSRFRHGDIINAPDGGGSSSGTSSGGGQTAHVPRTGWIANRHSLLSSISRIICFIPTLAYFPIVLQDYSTRQTGYDLSLPRTHILIVANFILIALIIALGAWCLSKWNEIDRLWSYFEEEIGNARWQAIDVSGQPAERLETAKTQSS